MRRSGTSTGLEAAIHQGAFRRSHFNFDARVVAPAAIAASLFAAGTYIAILMLAGRSDWKNIVVVAGAMGTIPLVAISLLFVGARRTHPFSISLAVVLFAASFVVSLVSGLRIPISYTGVLLTLPASIFFVTVANIAMMKAMRNSVALLSFPAAEELRQTTKWSIPVVEHDDIEMRYKRILIDPATHHTPEWSSRLARLYFRGIEIETWPSYLEVELGKIDLAAFDLSDVSYSPSQILYYKLKRTLDLIGVALIAAPAAILCSAIWIYIRLIDGAPSVFVQERRGYAGTIFKLYKFRTMSRGSSSDSSTVVGDKRILPGCHLLRQTRMDELPQLLNILKGEMSFIGPRPVAVKVAVAIEEHIPAYFNRHILLPGLTGWAQISQGYAQTQDEEIEKLSYDLYYLKHVSFDLDIIILFRTIKAVILRAGGR